MYLNELEKRVIQKFLDDKSLELIKRNINLDLINVDERELTGAGFLTQLTHCNELKVTYTTQSYQWGKLGAKLNESNIDTGYLIYVDNGYINTIEGYTYGGEEWPFKVTKIETYEAG